MSLIKKVEQGSVPPSSAFVAVSARALGVPVASLYGTDDGRQLAEESPGVRLDDLRVALEAWLLYGDRDRTLAELNAARRIAPFNTRHHPAVRETVLAMAESDRRTTDSLAGFARWAGVSL